MVGDRRVVPAAFDAGINFFFLTADMHWPLYEEQRRGLAALLDRGGGVRSEIVVGAVSYVTQPEFCYAPFQEAIAAVRGLGHLDVTIAGGAYSSDLPARLAAYRMHREGGLPGVGATAVSFHDRVAAREALCDERVDLGFVRYNPVHRGAVTDVFRHLPAAGSALVYTFKSTMGHLAEDEYARLGLGPDDWRPDPTDYYRYALTRPEVDGILCALDEEAHVAALAEALARGPLDDEDRQYLDDLGDLLAGRARLVAPHVT
jgi:hypothetical protein